MATFKIVQWPDVQELMDKPGFLANSSIIMSEELVKQYGYSAYFVDEDWLEALESLDPVGDMYMEEQEIDRSFEFHFSEKISGWETTFIEIMAPNYDAAIQKAIDILKGESSDYEFLDSEIDYDSIQTVISDKELTTKLYSSDNSLLWTNIDKTDETN